MKHTLIVFINFRSIRISSASETCLESLYSKELEDCVCSRHLLQMNGITTRIYLDSKQISTPSRSHRNIMSMEIFSHTMTWW